MWRATKLRSGFYKDGILLGVGYTDSHDVLSGEWTAGAIAAALEVALYYKDSHTAWAEEALADAQAMVKGMELSAYKEAVNSVKKDKTKGKKLIFAAAPGGIDLSPGNMTVEVDQEGNFSGVQGIILRIIPVAGSSLIPGLGRGLAL